MNITWDQVKAAKPALIYYSVNTVWWTHDPKDLQEGKVPLDVFGSPLFQIEASKYLNEAGFKSLTTWGTDPIKTLMVCHHKNIEWLRNHPDFERDITYQAVARLLETDIKQDKPELKGGKK